MKVLLSSPPIKIWYKPLPKLPQISWPIIDIKLSHKSISLPQAVLALVDSGANKSILHQDVADILGFDLKKLGLPAGGGTSVSGGYRSWNLPDPVDVYIYGFSVPVNFQVIDNPGLIWPCILGEDSIFQIARLDFRKFKGYFEMQFRQDLN